VNSCLTGLRQGAADVFREQQQVQAVGGAGLELGDEVEVKVTGLDRFRVHEQTTAPNVGGKLQNPGEHMLNTTSAEWTPGREG